MRKKKVIILGAAGRDFHNFNVYFRDNPSYEVVCFTAEQIPNIANRKYPAELAGPLYPNGIPIYKEEELPKLIGENNIDVVILAYSDLSHEEVMHKASITLANGADYMLLGPKHTTLKSTKPVISICAVRTGSGKSQTSRKVAQLLKKRGIKAVAIRHPMPYGDLVAQRVQRFATYKDFELHKCTIEEREEYEPYIELGLVVYAGVDYGEILKEAEKESEIIIWDGGNNDLPFYMSDLHIVIADPHRAGHEMKYHPGEANFRMADVVIINKVDTAEPNKIGLIEQNLKAVNPKAVLVKAASPVSAENPELIKGKRVLVVEDGPTLTHGEMRYGAGIVAAKKLMAKEIVDPRPYAVGSIKETFEKYSHLENLLPAMGYGEKQIKELEETINATPCDTVIIGTPINLGKLISIKKPYTRVRYTLEEKTKPDLEDILDNFLKKVKV